MIVAVLCFNALIAAATTSPDDLVKSLPTYGPVHTTQYAGFVDGTSDGASKLFYWFAECECGNTPDVPLLLWVIAHHEHTL